MSIRNKRHIGGDKRNKNRKQRKNPGSLGSNNARPITDGNYYRLMIASRSPFPLPLSFRTCLRYYEQVNFSAVSTPYVYVFRANSGYDPNQTGSGSQPVGWDNLLTFYNSTFVVGSKIVVTFINGGTVPIQFGIAPTIASNTISSYDNLKIYGRSTAFSHVDGTTRGSSSIKSLENEVVTLNFYGQPYDRDFQAQGQAAPSKTLFWTIAFQTSDQTSLITAQMQVEIFYDLVFSDPLLVPLS